MKDVEREYDEQLAGTTAPVSIPDTKRDADAEPIRVWPSNGGNDL